ncbi:sce7726 family protein [Pseudomonas alliivorans]|nr:sce7726 family protein [Pseudomonas alliivorans]
MSAAMSAEAKLKAAVVDRLFSSGILDNDAVLVSELTIDNWAHRTDLVLANGRLWGFELKSERDNLSRLPAQITSFSQHFEKFVLVVDEKFASRAAQLIKETSGAGLWISTGCGKLIEKIRPSFRPLAKSRAISLMTANELRKLLSKNGYRNIKNYKRADLVELAKCMKIQDLSNGARAAIKDRFRNIHLSFVDQRAIDGSLSALPTLTRAANKSNLATPTKPDKIDISLFPPVPKDHPNLIESPSGPVIARMKNKP